MSQPLRLGVNIDHVATVRNARGGTPARSAACGRDRRRGRRRRHHRPSARGSPPHRRRRHRRLMRELEIPLNFEMAATAEMVGIALKHRPHAACIVPEKREERTTEGGLDVAGQHNHLKPMVARLRRCRHPRVAVHRGRSAAARGGGDASARRSSNCTPAAIASWRAPAQKAELARLQKGAALCARLGLECHMGHGLSYADVAPIAAIPEVRELNIGHFLVGEAIFVGLDAAIREMRRHHGRCARRRGRRVILGIGNDLSTSGASRRSLERFGDRFVTRIFTEVEQKRSEGRADAGGELRQALRRQGGLRQGARHRPAPRRLLARHGRGQPARRQADPGADRRRAGAPAGDHAGRHVRRRSTSP